MSDLALLLLGVGVAVAAIGLEAPAIVRVPATILAVVLAPGYALTAVLFPTSRRPARGQMAPGRGITVLERAVLSVGLGLAVLPPAGIALDTAVGSVASGSVLAVLTGLTVAATGLAAVRRRRTPPADRYDPGLSVDRALRRPSDWSGPHALVLVVVLAVLVAGGAVAHSETGDASSAGVTELYLVGGTDDGDPPRAEYPTQFVAGSEQSLTVAVGNREGDDRTYTVVQQLQHAERDGESVIVREREELRRDRVRVAAGETEVVPANFTVESPGTYRLVVLLYDGEPPAEPRTENAYREVHLWVHASAAADATST